MENSGNATSSPRVRLCAMFTSRPCVCMCVCASRSSFVLAVDNGLNHSRIGERGEGERGRGGGAIHAGGRMSAGDSWPNVVVVLVVGEAEVTG